jgi:hypothetical protein
MARPKIDRVPVDRTEYDALCELRDVTHYQLQVRYDAALAINREQIARLTRQDLELAEARRQVEALAREVADLRARVPVTTTTTQPLFAK